MAQLKIKAKTYTIKVPPKATIVHKGEHAFHGSYLAAESIVGHGILQILAAGGLFFLILSIFIHEEASHAG